MNERHVIPEETPPDEEKHKWTPERLFCGALSEEDAAKLYERGVKNIENGLTGISDAHLAKFAKTYEKEDMSQADDREDDPLVSENRYTRYNAYQLFRAEGFSHDEVCQLCQAVADARLEDMLSLEIDHERMLANEFVTAHGEKIARADKELTGFVEQVRGQNSAYQKPKTLFTGKYQNLVIFSGNNGGNEIAPSSLSIYSTGENIVLVHIKELSAYQGFDDAKVSSVLHTYVHENVHSIGENSIEKGAAYLPLDPTSADVLHTGFFHSMEGDEKYRLFNVNEATTEYFARKISTKAGLHGNQGSYQPHVECLEKLFAYLEENNEVGLDERARVLGGQYGSSDGVESLRVQLESEVGSFALEVCDTLFDISGEFDQFLSALRQTKKGEHAEKELWISASRFQNHYPEIPLSQIRAAYPFLHFGVRAYDETAQKIIWKDVNPRSEVNS